MVNNILSKLANEDKISKSVIVFGAGISVISNILIFTGVYCLALRRGVELRDEYYESEERVNEQTD